MEIRVAKAIANDVGACWEDWIGTARKVIREMRTPTADMVGSNRLQEPLQPTNPRTRDDPVLRGRWEASCHNRIVARYACMVDAASPRIV